MIESKRPDNTQIIEREAPEESILFRSEGESLFNQDASFPVCYYCSKKIHLWKHEFITDTHTNDIYCDQDCWDNFESEGGVE